MGVHVFFSGDGGLAWAAISLQAPYSDWTAQISQESGWSLLLRPPLGVRDSVEVSTLSHQIMNIIEA